MTTQMTLFKETISKRIREPRPGDFIMVKGMTLHVDALEHEPGYLLTSDKQGREYIVPTSMIDAICP
jgi:hypothetical protein